MPAAKKPIRLDLSPADHKALRIQAATQGKAMSALAREVISNFLEKNSSEKARKNTEKTKKIE